MTALVIALAVLAAAVLQLSRKVHHMSQEFDKLKADAIEAAKELGAKNATIATLEADKAALTSTNATLTTQVADLQAQLATATGGTSDADLAAVDATLAGALDPAPAPAPEAPPAPEVPPAA